MANHESAKKEIKKNEKKRIVNRARIGRIRTFIKRVLHAVDSGNKEVAREEFKKAQPEIHRGVTKGVLHKNNAARKISRLSAKVKALPAA